MPVEQRKGIAAILLDAIGWLKRNLSGHKVAVDDEHVPYSVLEEYLHEYGRQWDIRNESGNKKKGDAFEVLSIYYLRNHPYWSKRFSQVVPFEKFSKRWQDNDLGTDVIAVTTGGDVWAIQCKCYAPHNKVNKVEVDSFIADSSRSIVKKRLLMRNVAD